MGDIVQCEALEPREDSFKIQCAFVKGHRGDHRFPDFGQDLTPEIRLRNALDVALNENEDWERKYAELLDANTQTELDLIGKRNEVYRERDACVALMAKLALKLGYPAGLGKHPASDESWDRDWLNIVYIEIPHPSGKPAQLSWHIHDSELPMFAFLPSYSEPWDGHTTAEKYQHMAEFCGDKA